METSRKPMKRWSDNELNCLVDEITGNYDFRTNQIKNDAREAFYNELSRKITLIESNIRTTDHVKLKWKNFKKSAKKKYEMRNLMKMAGKTEGLPKLTAAEEKIAWAIPIDSSKPEEDNTFYGQEDNGGDDEQYAEEEEAGETSAAIKTEVKVEESLYQRTIHLQGQSPSPQMATSASVVKSQSKAQGNETVSIDIRPVAAPIAKKRPGPTKDVGAKKKPKTSPGKAGDKPSSIKGSGAGSLNVPDNAHLTGSVAAMVDENQGLKKEKQNLINENQALKNINQALTDKALENETQILINQSLKTKLEKIKVDIQGLLANWD